MNNIFKLILGLVMVGCLGYGIGRYIQPAKVETKEVEVIKEVIKKDIEIVVREVEHPDGTKERTTTTKDKSVETSKKDTKKEMIVTENNKSQWKAHALIGADIKDVSRLLYGAQIERRVLGNLSIGAWGLTNQTVGVSVGFEF